MWDLYHAPHDVNLPCHRVVNSRGGLVPHWAEQKGLLLREEVAFKNNGCVYLKKHLWKIFSTFLCHQQQWGRGLHYLSCLRLLP
ncbi:MAG: hypothetical protein HPY50_09805 [Firmicutes bacterium]|nr:hypothetical protein [Bacillota bacterium]